jgi:hypothetical protein
MRGWSRLVLLLLVSAPRAAPGAPMVQFGAGVTFPAGAAASPLVAGGTLTAGVGWETPKRLGLSLDYFYAGNPLDHDIFRAQDLGGLHATHALTLVGRYTFGKPLGAYVLAGPGLYYRHVSISRVVGTAVGAYCDPILLYCAPTAVPVTDTLGTRDRIDPGLTGGFGITFASEVIRPYLEVRVHRMFGGSVKDAQGQSRSTSATLIPVMLGIIY